MNREQAIKWFDEVAAKTSIAQHASGRRLAGEAAVLTYDDASALEFVNAAEQAIKRVFPPHDPVVQRWDAIFEKSRENARLLSANLTVDAALALFREAKDLLEKNRIGNLVDGVRAETASELLDQADALLGDGCRAAAAVIAGGALETVLRHLCDRAAITPPGDGSITKYEGAIAQERKAGREILSVTDGKQVTSWGGMRNDAAHDPVRFGTDRTVPEVRIMVEGIRQFVARVVG
ncbi:MAG: hypothetical protein HY905_11280 [Deltaproteobacteria bacterium]|nr:hypothetical protein [Deltaproteobacteria bacterium]